MPMAPDKACLGCGHGCPPGLMRNGRCPKCAGTKGKQDYENRNITDPFHKKYLSSTWQRLSKLFKAQNPICMFIEDDGQQCRYPAQVVHHRIAAKEREDLFFDPKNLAALCNHHHGHTAGDPAGVKYVPAVFVNSMLPGQNLAEPNYSIAPPPPRK
jgi:hypothetical protein